MSSGCFDRIANVSGSNCLLSNDPSTHPLGLPQKTQSNEDEDCQRAGKEEAAAWVGIDPRGSVLSQIMNGDPVVFLGHVTFDADIAGFLGLFPQTEAQGKAERATKEGNQTEGQSTANRNRRRDLRTLREVDGAEDGTPFDSTPLPCHTMGPIKHLACLCRLPPASPLSNFKLNGWVTIDMNDPSYHAKLRSLGKR